jgi:hypothetical protein
MMTAPSCAAIFFSSRPDRDTNRNDPSEQLIANVSGDCFPDDGKNDTLVMNALIVVIFPVDSPSAPHLQITLSSLHDRSWQSGDHATDVVMSVSGEEEETRVAGREARQGKRGVCVNENERRGR